MHGTDNPCKCLPYQRMLVTGPVMINQDILDVATTKYQLYYCMKTACCILGYGIMYRGADKSLVRPTSLLIVFPVQGTGGSPTGTDPEYRVGEQDTGSPGRPVSSGLQVPGEPFPSWSG
jgi:hypothetical protein